MSYVYRSFLPKKETLNIKREITVTDRESLRSSMPMFKGRHVFTPMCLYDVCVCECECQCVAAIVSKVDAAVWPVGQHLRFCNSISGSCVVAKVR